MHDSLSTIHGPLTHLPDELRLVILIGVNVFVFIAAFKFVRRITSQDRIAATLDALLIHYLVQYVSVCVPGLLGVLCAETMLASALILGAAMLYFPRRAGFSPHVLRDEEMPKTCGLKPARRFEAIIFSASLLFVIGYFCGLIQTQTAAALVGDDALTYHLPAAAFWLQTHHIGLYNTWFFNPANTYSPLAGSTFFAWLIAPIGVDLLARFGQMPALILMFCALVEIGRALNVRVSIASLIAAGCLLSRPFISEAILVKDDHFLAAFFIAAIAGCAQNRIADRLGPWRIGIAVGLFFATKYTALLTAPLFILAIDAPLRAKWKPWQWLIALACIFAIAAPWYLRNWILTGNPLYPVPVTVGSLEIFKGMFIPERSTEMRTVAGAWKALTGEYSSLAPALVGALAVGWLGAIALAGRRAIRDPLLRTCLIGPALGLSIFFLASHAALIRYAFPSLLLLFICCALFIAQLPIPKWCRLIAALFAAAIAMWGAFNDKDLVRTFIQAAAILCAIGMFVMLVIGPLMHRRSVRVAVWCIAGLTVACAIYIYWNAIVVAARQTDIAGMRVPYPDKVGMWGYIRDHVPADASIAYTNLVFTRPLMGFDYTRPVFYIPTRDGVRDYSDLPNSRDRVTDEQIRGFVADLLTQNPNETMWRENLLHSDANYLLIGRQSVLADPPEKAFADHDPAHFALEFVDDFGQLYRIVR